MGEVFSTDRLIVRHFGAADLNDFAALCADPRVMQHVGDGTTLTRAEVAHWIEVCQVKYAERGYGTSAVLDRSSGDFVGYCGVVRAPERDFDELVYVLDQRWWGRGFATEVAREMLRYVFSVSDLEAIAATIDPENEASMRVVRKLGLNQQRSIPDEVGKLVALWCITRREFETRGQPLW